MSSRRHQGSRQSAPDSPFRHDARLRQGDVAFHARDALVTSAAYVAKRLSKHAVDVMRNGRGMTLTNAMRWPGGWQNSAFDLKIPLWLSRRCAN